MDNAAILLIGSATLGVFLSIITRHGYRGIEGRVALQSVPLPYLLLSGAGLPCQLALVAWAFLTYPLKIALAGLVFFVVVVSILAGMVMAPMMQQRSVINVLRKTRYFGDALLIAGTVALWWHYFPIGLTR